jgi:basic membrane protein A
VSNNNSEKQTVLKSRRAMLASLGTAGAAALAGCAGSGGDGETDSLNAAWLYFSEVGDLGWTYSHDQGRKAAQEQLDYLETDYSESVPANRVEQSAIQYSENGFDVVFGASGTFTDAIGSAAERKPDDAFLVAGGFQKGEAYSNFMSKLYQARYLVGYASGLVTEKDRIGYVAANPVSSVYQEVNGFASGVQDANPDATVYLRFSNTWFDPPKEGEIAQALIDDRDVDVMAQHQDSPAVMRTAADSGLWTSGYAADMSDFGGENHLMDPVFKWENVFVPIIEQVRNEEWEPGFVFPGIDDGAADVTDPSSNVPDDVVSEVTSIKEEMTAGDPDSIVWEGSEFADWSDEELLFSVDSVEYDNVEGRQV